MDWAEAACAIGVNLISCWGQGHIFREDKHCATFKCPMLEVPRLHRPFSGSLYHQVLNIKLIEM